MTAPDAVYAGPDDLREVEIRVCRGPRHWNPPYSVRGSESVPLGTKCHEMHICGISDVNLILYGIGEDYSFVREEDYALVHEFGFASSSRTASLR
jgi:hypothetical protein